MVDLLDDISYLTELAAFLCVAYFHWKHRTRRSSLLLVLLAVVVLVESLNKFHRFADPALNLLLLNGVIVVEFVCYAIFYRWSIGTRSHRRVIEVGVLLYGALVCLNSAFLQPATSTIQTYSYILGALLVLICILLYFHEVIVTSTSSIPLHRRYYMWISVGLFLFLSAEIPVMMILNYMIGHGISTSEWPIFQVKLLVSIVYYSTYLIGLPWTSVE